MKRFIATITLMAAVLCGAVYNAPNIAPTSTSRSSTPTSTHAPLTSFHPTKLATPTTTATTQSSTTFPVKVPVDKLALAIASLFHDTAVIHVQLELAGSAGNETGLRQVAAAIKKTEAEAVKVGVMIKEAKLLLLPSVPDDLPFSHRLELGLFELKTKGAGRFLAEMGELALGMLGGLLARWPQLELSEALVTAERVLNGRFVQVAQGVVAVDRALRGEPAHLKVANASVRAVVDGGLQRLATAVEGLRLEASRVLAEEEGRLRLEGREVNLWQRFEFEMMVDQFSFTVSYTKNFKALFDRVNGGGGGGGGGKVEQRAKKSNI
ncbi:hypothetical protein TYRP_023102 [Tyrophagus putrescentiae]|nr:hypothetical protein TYRP_023102 [Tyrophagus putrescentiae]